MPPDTAMEVDCRTLKQKLDAGADFLLLDCRERDEHSLVRIEGSTLIPMSELQTRAAELDRDRQKEIIVHCHHGGRSLQVTAWLRQQGFANVHSLAGGIDRWATEIDPTLPRY